VKIKFENPNSFDGVHRSCVQYKKAKGGLRCAKFQEGLPHPKCPGAGLKGGGRSQNYIRGKKKRCATRGGK
jgi:hypothetical protein